MAASRTILITTAHGMFGSALLRELTGRGDVHVRAMVHSRRDDDVDTDSITYVTADLDDPTTLPAVCSGITDAFLATPMDGRIAARETALIDAVREASPDARILAISGAVDHQGDALSLQHQKALDHLKSSGLRWSILSPNSVMETSLLPYAGTIENDAIFGMSGDGRIGLVALADVARVGADVLCSDDTDGQEFVCTGPEAVTMAQVCAAFSEVLDRTIHYYDLPEADLAKLLLEHGGYTDPQQLDTEVLCHFRAWARGGADVVTDTVHAVTGQAPQDVRSWIEDHRGDFDAKPGVKDRMLAWLMHLQFGKYEPKG
jgi:uncharacterized protein YbjT (DUF2867 family)